MTTLYQGDGDMNIALRQATFRNGELFVSLEVLVTFPWVLVQMLLNVWVLKLTIHQQNMT